MGCEMKSFQLGSTFGQHDCLILYQVFKEYVVHSLPLRCPTDGTHHTWTKFKGLLFIFFFLPSIL